MPFDVALPILTRRLIVPVLSHETMHDIRPYFYVGPEHLKLLRRQDGCFSPKSIRELIDWVKRQINVGRNSGMTTATFVVDCHERLWIADRRSEHVACADGGPVLAAGEMVFAFEGGEIEVAEISNQSTGYCPEPECWAVAVQTLDRLSLPRPEAWTHAFVFRRCPSCSAINIIKDGILECDICGTSLPEIWNFDDPDDSV